MAQSIEDILSEMAEEIQTIDYELMMDIVSVHQASDQLKKALDKVDHCLDQRNIQEAAALGYRDVASAFIFLQRTLGALQTTEHKKESLISEVAVKAKLPYEKVAPFVEKIMESSQPRNK